ncbi:hypothetical protein ES705_41651 [subsurface metagenome]
MGALDPVYRRFFDRSFSDVKALAEVLEEARAAGTDRVEVLLNPEEILKVSGKAKEKAVLQALQSALAKNAEKVTGRPEVHLTLFWDSRNAGYLLRSLNGSSRSKSKVDLLLEVGPEPQFHNPEHWRVSERFDGDGVGMGPSC